MHEKLFVGQPRRTKALYTCTTHPFAGTQLVRYLYIFELRPQKMRRINVLDLSPVNLGQVLSLYLSSRSNPFSISQTSQYRPPTHHLT